MALQTFKAVSTLKAGLSVENSSREFKVLMDEPETIRGTNTGMNPVEMLLCCLGACQCIVARLFARAQKIELEELTIELEGDLDPAGFLKGSADTRPGFGEIRYTIRVKTKAPMEKVESYAEFVKSRCPVSDNLLHGVNVVLKEIVIEP